MTPLAALAALSLLACTTQSDGPDVVVIVADTLRADHLGSYGYERDTSPNLDALAAESTLFTQAWSTAPWTAPSVASLITGLYPGSHELLEIAHRLGPEHLTLAERLSEAGYATGGVVANPLLNKGSGLHRGYDRYRTFIQQKFAVPADVVTAGAREVLAELDAGGDPWFLYAHYIDPHCEYNRHPEYGFVPEGAAIPEGATYEDIQARDQAPTPSELAYLVGAYDEEIRFMDAAIGELLADVRARSPEAVIVFTSDHGEAFYEHGWLGHTRDLYEELVRIPLIVHVPGAPAQRAAEPVSLVSIAPTILEIAGLKHKTAQGPSLLTRLRGGAPPEAGMLFAEVDYEPIQDRYSHKRSHKKAVLDAHQKLIVDDLSGAAELYDLAADPAELAPREDAALQSELAAALGGFQRWTRDGGEAPAREITDREMEALRALGYVE